MDDLTDFELRRANLFKETSIKIMEQQIMSD